jgi:hypothetical protein
LSPQPGLKPWLLAAAAGTEVRHWASSKTTATDTKTTITKMTVSIGGLVRKGCGGNRGSGGVSVTRPPQPFSSSERQQDSDSKRGKSTGGQEAVVLREVAQQLTPNQRTREAWQKAAAQQKAEVAWQQEAAW